MKKEIEMCDWCEEEQALWITKNNEKLCDDCLEDWKEDIIEDLYKKLKEENKIENE